MKVVLILIVVVLVADNVILRLWLRDTKVRLTAYEKQWTEMNYTICKYQEENAQLRAKKP